MLYGEEGDFPTKYIVKADRELRWDTVRMEKGVSYPLLRILPVDPKKPPKKAYWKHEAVIFGFEPVESLFEGQPKVSKNANGETVAEYVVPAGELHVGQHQRVVFDTAGRVESIAYQDPPTAKNHWNEVWTASDYAQANKGWVPKTITRKVFLGDRLGNSKNYKLAKLETGPSVLEKWFADSVSGPTFVQDSRYHGESVKYFTRDKFLSDEEVERRASVLASQVRAVQRPRSPWKVVGTGLILLGVALLIWKVGWSRKQSG